MVYNDLLKRLFYNHVGILIVLGIGFFFVYSWLSFATLPEEGGVWRFNSPDATANFIFAQQVAEYNRLSLEEPLNLLFEDSVHPRSVNVFGSSLVPAGFLGLPVLYGVLAKVVGVNSIAFLTSFFSVAAVLAFYGFIRRLFGKKVAYLSALLLFIHPVFWYYTSRGLLPNVLFVDLFIIGLYFLGSMRLSWIRDASLSRAVVAYALAAGISFGLALLVRPAEMLWVILLLLTLWVIYRRVVPVKLVVIFAGVLGCFFVVLLILHAAVYGHALATGYQQLAETATAEITAKVSLWQYFLPFGIDLKMFVVRIFNFVVQFFWWLTTLLILGLASFIIRLREKPLKQKTFFGYVLLLLVYLGLYYSSLEVGDTISLNAVTIGTSYLRYWLPFLIKFIPFIVLGLIFILQALQVFGRKFQLFGRAVAVFFLLTLSVQMVVQEGNESLSAVRTSIHSYQKTFVQVREIIPSDAIIVTEFNDKVFFPEYRVIVPTERKKVFEQVVKLLEEESVWYYTLASPDDVLKNKMHLVASEPLTLRYVTSTTEGEYLYEIIVLEPITHNP